MSSSDDLHDRRAEADRRRAPLVESRRRPSPGSTLWWISLVAFQIRNRPPAIRIRSRTEKAVSKAGCAVDQRAVQAEVDQRRGQPDQPGDRRQQQQPHHQRQPDADAPRLALLLGRQLVRQDRDEDEIVDAEHDLHHDQRSEGGPGGGIGDERKDGLHDRRDRARLMRRLQALRVSTLQLCQAKRPIAGAGMTKWLAALMELRYDQ